MKANNILTLQACNN